MKLDDDEGERENSDMYLVHKDLTFCTSLKFILSSNQIWGLVAKCETSACCTELSAKWGRIEANKSKTKELKMSKHPAWWFSLS